MNKIDGLKLANEKLEILKREYELLEKKYLKKASLTTILIGDNEASKIYIKNKEKYCNKVGILTKNIYLKSNITTDEVIDIIRKENENEITTAILVQLPLLKHLNQEKIIQEISSKKDVDGFGFCNLGKLFKGYNSTIPCTPKAIMYILEKEKISISGKDILIIGRSNIVSKPLAMLLLNKDATITISHTKTKDLTDKIKRADIIITATGSKIIDENTKLKNGVVIIDVGIIRTKEGIRGDVSKLAYNREEIKKITPTPKGVGPLTITFLIENIIEKFKEQNKNKG